MSQVVAPLPTLHDAAAFPVELEKCGNEHTLATLV